MTYEQFICSLCLWREARGASQAAKAAILAVIRNRSQDARNRWPKTLLGVILQPLQFSSFNANDPNASKLPNPLQAVDWLAFQDCMVVVKAPLTADPTQGATNYESCAVGELPAWADPAKLTTTIGPFRFYKL